ncbi:conserved hypothetical protein [Ricinus communis]|uniref:Uncharacterized protein n=1 Tax=Ricinus communis TaxID=3988 RepID=B9SJU4_RICCO|nr:conserved hypothetical protein [Ricinus communis]
MEIRKIQRGLGFEEGVIVDCDVSNEGYCNIQDRLNKCLGTSNWVFKFPG